MDEAQIIAEGKALNAALAVVENQGDRQKAIDLVRIYREKFTRSSNIEGATIDLALWVICGTEPLKTPTYPQFITKENDRFTQLAQVWMTWVRGLVDDELKEVIPRLEDHGQKGEIFNKMVLEEWMTALEALFSHNIEESRKRFRRAMRLGWEYGTPSNPIVQWTYAASFFNH